MAESKYKYVYQDTIKTTKVFDEMLGKDVNHLSAEHHPKHTLREIISSLEPDDPQIPELINRCQCPISYDKERDVCFIHSNYEISGLPLVDQDSEIRPNIKKTIEG